MVVLWFYESVSHQFHRISPLWNVKQTNIKRAKQAVNVKPVYWVRMHTLIGSSCLRASFSPRSVVHCIYGAPKSSVDHNSVTHVVCVVAALCPFLPFLCTTELRNLFFFFFCRSIWYGVMIYFPLPTFRSLLNPRQLVKIYFPLPLPSFLCNTL